MKKFLYANVLFSFLVLLIVSSANAVVVDFTGGTAYMDGGGTATPNNSDVYNNVDYYEEDGFKLDFIGDVGIIGDYYSGNNDVIHGHWHTGDYGNLTEIRVSKLDGTPFDLNYFILTSNTDEGGGQASNNEQTYINSSNGYSQLLPSDDWGWFGPNPQLFLDSNFDGILWFSFTVANAVDCFGMDNFYIDEPPPAIPEPATIFLLGFGLVGLVGAIGKKLKK